MNENLNVPMIGQPFPEIEVTTTFGEMKLPQDYAGKWFVFFSHPSAYTPVCTTEFMTFADKAEEFAKLDTELIGLSVGDAVAHIKWTEWIEDQYGLEINFPIVADLLGQASKKLGMLHGATGTNTVRSVFIVDDKGIIRTMLHYPQEAGRSIDEILRILKALKYESEHNVSMPENWPNNKFFGDDVIVKPARTHQAIAEFEKSMKDHPEYDYRDWWFVTKKAEHEE